MFIQALTLTSVSHRHTYTQKHKSKRGTSWEYEEAQKEWEGMREGGKAGFLKRTPL